MSVKKKALAIVLIAIIALALTTWFVYNQISALQNQISDLQAQNSELQDQNSDLQEKVSELQNQLAELQNKTGVASNVKITAFEWLGGLSPVIGLTLSHPVNVTVANAGVNDVRGLNLTAKLVYTGTQIEVDGRAYVKQIDVIHAGEVLEFSGDIWATMGSFSKDSARCVITLTWGDIVLDEWRRSLPSVY
jgi:uncharacterized protein YlxW (UPF0749 family)